MFSLEQDRALLHAWADAKAEGMTRLDYAVKIGRTPKQLDNMLYKAQARVEYYKRVGEPRQAPGLDGMVPSLEGDAIVVGDIHCPYQDEGMLWLMEKVAKAKLPKGKRNLIIAGDLLNMDAFSRFATSVPSPTWVDERQETARVITLLDQTFDSIWWLMGNHERRMSHRANVWTDDMVSAILAQSGIRNFGKLHYSVYSYMTLTSGETKYRITHPKDYSRIPGRVAEHIANRYNTHVVSYHEHHLSMHKTSNGYLCINGGCMIDASRVPYVSLEDNRSPEMQLGFVSIIDGYPTLYDNGVMYDYSKIRGIKL